MRLFEIEDDLINKYKSEVDFALDKFNTYNIAIYRGSSTYNKADVIYTDPTARTTNRKSAMGIGNYYTVWMDNNPQWAEYPKRGKSLICSSNLRFASSYGYAKVVIPLTNCKIGICPSNDIWKSFNSVYSLGDFSDWLYNDVFSHIRHDHRNITYDELLQILNQIDISNLKLPYNVTSTFKQNMLDDRSGINMFETVFDPVNNDFKLTDWHTLTSFDHTSEVWLSSPCLLIGPEMFDELAEDRK